MAQPSLLESKIESFIQKGDTPTGIHLAIGSLIFSGILGPLLSPKDVTFMEVLFFSFVLSIFFFCSFAGLIFMMQRKKEGWTFSSFSTKQDHEHLWFGLAIIAKPFTFVGLVILFTFTFDLFMKTIFLSLLCTEGLFYGSKPFIMKWLLHQGKKPTPFTTHALAPFPLFDEFPQLEKLNEHLHIISSSQMMVEAKTYEEIVAIYNKIEPTFSAFYHLSPQNQEAYLSTMNGLLAVLEKKTTEAYEEIQRVHMRQIDNTYWTLVRQYHE